MNYRVSFTRPYLSAPRCFDTQHEVIVARDEEQVRAIYADCEIVSVEPVDSDTHPKLPPAKMIVTKSFAERWTTNPDHYREHFGIDNVEVQS